MATLRPVHTDRLAQASRELLAGISGRQWADDFYLAGSAALTLYLGHRPVHALDLMGAANRLAASERRALLEDFVALDPKARVETARDGYLYVRASNGVGVKLFYFPYPLVDPEGEAEGVAVASAVDLGLMKLAAIISRGSRRDFVDLYLLCRELPLADLLDRSGDKFGHVRDFPLQALKGLSDLSLTEGEPMPRLDEPLEWEAVVEWVRDEARRLGRQHIGLGDDS